MVQWCIIHTYTKKSAIPNTVKKQNLGAEPVKFHV